VKKTPPKKKTENNHFFVSFKKKKQPHDQIFVSLKKKAEATIFLFKKNPTVQLLPGTKKKFTVPFPKREKKKLRTGYCAL
jgi:hypothetical protein